jgi:hypothetical protein
MDGGEADKRVTTAGLSILRSSNFRLSFKRDSTS